MIAQGRTGRQGQAGRLAAAVLRRWLMILLAWALLLQAWATPALAIHPAGGDFILCLSQHDPETGERAVVDAPAGRDAAHHGATCCILCTPPVAAGLSSDLPAPAERAGRVSGAGLRPDPGDTRPARRAGRPGLARAPPAA